MSEQPKPTEEQTFMVDVNKFLTVIAGFYKQFSWTLPLIERFGGVKIPREIITALDSLASGKPLTPEQMLEMKTSIEGMQPAVGEPVMTRSLAQTAWWLHYKEGMGTRDIAEQFTKDGSPCSHATVARWINMIDEERRFSRIAMLISIGKIMLMTVVPTVIAFLIGRTFF